MSRSDYLFSSADLSATIGGLREKLTVQIRALEANQLLSVSEDGVSQHFVGEYTINPIQLHEEGVALIEPREVEIESYSQDWGRSYLRKQLEFCFEVPFSGDHALLNCRPSTWSTMVPHAKYDKNKIRITFYQDRQDGEAIKRYVSEQLSLIKQYLGWQREEIDRWNQALPEFVQQHVALRRAKLIADKKLVEDLGFMVIKRGASSSGYTIPVQQKPVIPPLPPPRPGAVATPEPVLEGAVYEQILDTLAQMSLVMERCPSAFEKIDEESLRMHFLLPLNANFKGMASGETFHAAGKTDILIKHQDRVLFIAECKFWKGAQSLTYAISQLLSYTTWRETKCAILLFNRNKDFSAVLQQVPGIFSAHPQFVRKVDYPKQTGYRCILRSPHDAQRHLTVTLLAFDIPGANNQTSKESPNGNA